MTTPTDYRALCAELEHAAQELELAENALLCSSFHNSAIRAKAAAHRARAALAQPEQEGPSDDELYELWNSEGTDADFQECRRFARTILTRWGRLTIKP